MPKVTILPLERVIDAAEGATIMEAAHEHGLYWPTTCGGQGTCTTCLATVVGGSECLLGMSRSERKTIVAERGEAALRRPLRLACQAIVQGGPIVVRKTGVRLAE